MLASGQAPHRLVGQVDLSQPLPTLVREVFARVFTEQTPHDSVNVQQYNRDKMDVKAAKLGNINIG